jgi:hypothetical protein
MARKGVSYTCPPKRFAIPADYKALGGPGTILIQPIRQWTAVVNNSHKARHPKS